MDAKLRAEIEEAERIRRSRAASSAFSEPARLPCGHYAPDPVAGRPAPPASECKWCKREAMGNRATAKTEQPRKLDPGGTYTPREWELLEGFYAKHPDRRPGGGLSEQERERLVEMMDARREEERAKDRASDPYRGLRTGKVVYLGAGGEPRARDGSLLPVSS